MAGLKVAVALLFLVGCAVGDDCAKESPKVGYTAELSTLEHGVSAVDVSGGCICVVHDCELLCTGH